MPMLWDTTRFAAWSARKDDATRQEALDDLAALEDFPMADELPTALSNQNLASSTIPSSQQDQQNNPPPLEPMPELRSLNGFAASSSTNVSSNPNYVSSSNDGGPVLIPQSTSLSEPTSIADVASEETREKMKPETIGQLASSSFGLPPKQRKSLYTSKSNIALSYPEPSDGSETAQLQASPNIPASSARVIPADEQPSSMVTAPECSSIANTEGDGSEAPTSTPSLTAPLAHPLHASQSLTTGIHRKPLDRPSELHKRPSQPPSSSTGIDSEGLSHLQKMLSAGVSPSEEMRRAFGRAVNHILPCDRTSASTGKAGDAEVDTHIRHLAPIIATAYSQIVDAGMAISRPATLEREPTSSLTHDLRKKFESIAPDSNDHGRAPQKSQSSKSRREHIGHELSRELVVQVGTARAHRTNDTSISRQTSDSDGILVPVPSNDTAGLNTGMAPVPPNDSNLGVEDSPVAMSIISSSTVPTGIGTLEKGIATLDRLLLALEDERRTLCHASLATESRPDRMPEQAASTVVFKFNGSSSLSVTTYTFEVTELEAEAASQWTRRMLAFDPEREYLTYILRLHVGQNSADPAANLTSSAGDLAFMTLNGKQLTAPRILTFGSEYNLTSRIMAGVNTLKVVALVDASDITFCVERCGPSEEDILAQVRRSRAWNTLTV